MASISTAENDKKNLAGDDEWETFKFDDDAKPNEPSFGEISIPKRIHPKTLIHTVVAHRRGQRSFLRKTALEPI